MNKILNVTETIFDEKRTELLELLDKADDVVDRLTETGDFSSVSENLQSQINTTRQRCYEGLFSIALIAAFQSGKSTTLNTFADGREIAPRGLGGGGVKTSACLVKVQNPDEGEEETVKVTWRSEQDLLLRLDEALGVTARQINSKTAEKLKEIKHKEDLILLEHALQIELEVYSQITRKGSPEMQGKEDFLRFAMIVLAYYNDPTLKNLQTRDKFKPEEIESYLKFPDNFTNRWNKCFKDSSQNLTKQEFSLEEVMYAFIEEVTYVVTSENLQKLGAQIVDCPGLLASTYDTSVASNAMQEASAIWFLLSGDKQLSESDKIALNHILEIGCEEKVLFGFNYKKQLQKDDEGNFIAPVIKEILEQLKTFGFTASHQVKPLDFNAFLALRAMQGKKLLDNSLDQFSKHQIIKDAEAMLDEDFNSVEKAWLESVIEVMSNIVLGKKELRKILSLEFNAETVKLIREKSQWDSATEQIKEYVFKNKAWSVLVDLGCQPVINTLEKAESSLKIAEDNAQKKQEEAQKEWAGSREKLDEFITKSSIVLEDNINELWDSVLAKTFWEDVCVTSWKLTGDNAAEKVLNETTFGKGIENISDNIGNLGKDIFNSVSQFFSGPTLEKNKLIGERVGEIIKRELENSLSKSSQKWFGNLKKGGNPAYEKNILPRIKRASQQLEKDWKDLELDHDNYLKGLDVNIPQFTGDIRNDLEKYPEAFDQAVVGAISKGGFSAWVSFITGVFYLMVIDLFIPGLGTLLTIIGTAIIGLLTVFKTDEQRKEDISKKITEELNQEFRNNREMIELKLQDKLSIIREVYSQAIKNSFAEISRQLEERISQAKDQLALNQVEREKIAETAKKFRTQELEPLQHEMEQFKSSVEKIWEKPY